MKWNDKKKQYLMFEQEVQKQLLPNIIYYHYIYHFSMGIIQEETVK